MFNKSRNQKFETVLIIKNIYSIGIFLKKKIIYAMTRKLALYLHLSFNKYG